MKSILLTTAAAVVLVGCGDSESPRILIHDATTFGDIEAVKQHLAAGKNLNVKSGGFISFFALCSHFLVTRESSNSSETVARLGEG
ncbi:hypothetical protein OAG94_02470 [bacterium]|nr:hypothetical protein [bacterium]